MVKNRTEKNLKDFSKWVEQKRKEKQWSLENLARELEKQGYPISKNKLWRIEHISESNLKKIDLELKVRLEGIFEGNFSQHTTNQTKEELALSIIDLIDKWKIDPFSIEPPDDPLIKEIYLHLIR